MTGEPLTVGDFIAETEGVEPGDIPLDAQSRMDDALEGLTGATPPGNPPGGSTLTVDAAGGGDYETVSAAVDAASPGDTIQVLAGTYTEDVLIDTDSVTVVGAGDAPGDVVIESTGTGYQGEGDPVAPLEIVGEYVTVQSLTIAAVEDEGYGYGVQVSGVSGASNATLSEVRVDGASGNNTGEFGTGIRVRGAANTVVEAAIVNGGSDVDYGIRAQEPGTTVVNSEINHCDRCVDIQSSGNLVQGNTINGITAESPDGFYKDPEGSFPNGKGIRVSTTPSGSNNTVKSNEINDCALGIEAFGSENTVVDNAIAGCGTGITVANGASKYTIFGNSITGGDGRGISVFSGSEDNHQIENNTVSDQRLGIVLSGADDNSVVGNSLTGNQANGIWLNDGAGSASGNTIENNTVSNNGFAEDGPFPGIFLGNAVDTVIQDNQINGNAAQGVSDYASSDTVVDDNTLENNGAGLGEFIYSGVFVYGEAEDPTVTNNTLVDNYFRGIWVMEYSGTLSISGNDIELRYPDEYEKIVTPSGESSLGTSSVEGSSSGSLDGTESPEPAHGGTTPPA